MTNNGLPPAHGRYVLNAAGQPVPEPNMERWARWFETADRSIGDHTAFGVRVSTVFLGMNHRFFGEGPPILWETCVFWGDGDSDVVERYDDKEDADRGHQLWRGKVAAGLTSADIGGAD